MIGTITADTVGHLAVCSLSLLAAAYYLSHFPREAKHWLRHYRHEAKAMTGKYRALRRWVSRLAVLCGLALSSAPIALYVIHATEAGQHLLHV